jgi:hypothetical protein
LAEAAPKAVRNTEPETEHAVSGLAGWRIGTALEGLAEAWRSAARREGGRVEQISDALHECAQGIGLQDEEAAGWFTAVAP